MNNTLTKYLKAFSRTFIATLSIKPPSSFDVYLGEYSMAMVINTNTASLNAQRNLGASQSSMNEAMQRLSSGLRINSAKDDAAGLAIATRFTTQINGLNQAARNANDGISLAQTGESALQEVTNNLQRIRELAIQSANSTNSASDREALDSEVQQRIAEITRISGQTSFNGQKVLNGSMGTASFQIGANVGETIDITLSQGMRSDQIGSTAQIVGTAATSTALSDGNLQISVGGSSAVSVGASVAGPGNGQTASSAYAKVEAINAASVNGLSASASTSVTTTIAYAGADNANDKIDLSINSVDIYAGLDVSGGAPSVSAMTEAINAKSQETGVIASYSGSDLTLTAADGRDIEVSQTLTDGGGTALSGGFTSATTTGVITLEASDSIQLSGTASGGATEIGSANLTQAVDTSKNLSTQNIKTVAGAEATIQSIDSALKSVSNLRSDFGAIQNRFESTISNLSTISENLSASRSRIEDADFAAETAKMSRAQVLQQAGTSILSQANASTQSVLSLLQ